MCCCVSYHANVWFCSENGNRITSNELISAYIVPAFLETQGHVTEVFLRLLYLPNVLFLVLLVVLRLPKRREIACEIDERTGDLSPVAVLSLVFYCLVTCRDKGCFCLNRYVGRIFHELILFPFASYIAFYNILYQWASQVYFVNFVENYFGLFF